MIVQIRPNRGFGIIARPNKFNSKFITRAHPIVVAGHKPVSFPWFIHTTPLLCTCVYYLHPSYAAELIHMNLTTDPSCAAAHCYTHQAISKNGIRIGTLFFYPTNIQLKNSHHIVPRFNNKINLIFPLDGNPKSRFPYYW